MSPRNLDSGSPDAVRRLPGVRGLTLSGPEPTATDGRNEAQSKTSHGRVENL